MKPALLFRAATSLAALGLVLLSACITQPVAPAARNDALPLDQAVAAAADALAQQAQKLPALLAKLNKQAMVLDPSLDSGSGQQTLATQQLDKLVAERFATRYEGYEVLPFRAANLARAQLLLTGTFTRAAQDYRLQLSLTDLKTGNVVAQSSAVAAGSTVDMSPLAYYRDSPVLVKDKVIEGYIRTTATAPGQRADAFYLERIATATLVQDAMVNYNAERYQDALGQYRSALATPVGEQMRALTGVYLSTAKLGRAAEAEQAFGRVVAFGVASRELGVKFLFNPGSTDFWSDSRVSGAYGMWLRQIAKESSNAKVCMDVVGHTSKTGSESFNDALSLRRATSIKQRLSAEAADLGPRIRPLGMGFRENIVGSGTDDTVDALDRRVEFKISACP